MLVRTKLLALKLSALPEVRMTVPVILGRARRSSVPNSQLENLSPSKGTDDRPGHPRTSRMLVRTKLPALKLSALPEVRMTVPVILGRAGRSSVPPIQFAYTSITPRIHSPKIQLYPVCESG